MPLFESRRDGSPPMTRDLLTDVSISNTEEFETVLATAVEKAIESDVVVPGAWAFETRGSTHNRDVEIVELAKDLADGS